MKRAEKEATVERLKSDLEPGGHLILTEYRGLTVEQLSELRRKVRAAAGAVRVMKNTLVRRAVEGTEKEAIRELLEGPNALVFTKADPVPVVRAVAEAAKGFEALKLRGGIVEGKAVTAEQLVQIAELPSREVLLGKALGSLTSPLAGLVNVLQGNLRNLVYVLEAIRQGKAEA